MNRLLAALENLLNSRCLYDLPKNDPLAGTVLDYGLPADFFALAASSENDAKLGQLLQRKITAFERRLEDVAVAVSTRTPGAVVFAITATIASEVHQLGAQIRSNGHFEVIRS